MRKRGGRVDKEVAVLEGQAQTKQAKLYAALEDVELELKDLSPRVKKLRSQVHELSEAVASAKLHRSSAKPLKTLSMKEIESHVANLPDLLASGSVSEREALSASFIKGISVNYQEISVTYTIPLIKKPSFNSEVLSVVTNGGVYETSSPTGSSRMRPRD